MSTNRDFFMTIPDSSLEDWELFIKKADLDETYPADILLEFVKEFVDEHRSELVDDSESKPKKVIVRKAAPKKKAAPSLTAKNFKWNEGLVGRAAKRKEAFPTMDQVEAAHLKAVLDAYGGDIQRTGLALGIARSTVYRKMKRYKLR